MAKTSSGRARRRPRVPAAIMAVGRRGARQEGRRRAGARPARRRRLHRLLRRLHRPEPPPGPGHRRRAWKTALKAKKLRPSARRGLRQAASGCCSTTSTSSSTSSRPTRAIFYGLERLWGNADAARAARADSRRPPAVDRRRRGDRGSATARRADDPRRSPTARSRRSSRRAARCAATLLDRPLDGAVCPACWARVARFTPAALSRAAASRCRARGAPPHGTLRRLLGRRSARSPPPAPSAPSTARSPTSSTRCKYGRRPSVAPAARPR